MKVYVIGSVDQEETIKSVARKWESFGCEIRYVKKEDTTEYSVTDLVHSSFLTIEEWADMIVVVPKPSGFGKIFIDDGTIYEIEHANSFGKPVFIYKH